MTDEPSPEQSRADFIPSSEAPPGQIWVCGACGKTSKNKYRLGDTSCVIWAVLCFEKTDPKAVWKAVPRAG